MMLNSDIQILVKIKKARRGALFFISDFANFGKPDTISRPNAKLQIVMDKFERTNTRKNPNVYAYKTDYQRVVVII